MGRNAVVVIGAGAAGLTAAIFAANAGAAVTLVDGQRRIGVKIRASGGGRCNILPSAVVPGDFWGEGAAAAFDRLQRRWPLEAIRSWFEVELGLPLATEATGKVFPASSRADDVVDALLAAAERAGVVLRTGAAVTALRPIVSSTVSSTASSTASSTVGPAVNSTVGPAVSPTVTDLGPAGAALDVELADGAVLAGARVVVATGGLSLPRSGSDGSGQRLATGLGHRLAPCYPALVPLTIEDAELRDLAGVALPVSLSVWQGGAAIAEERGDLLVTHRGLSGPAVLQISRWLTQPSEPSQPPRKLRIHWGEANWPALLADGQGGRRVGAAVRRVLPSRLADRLVARAGVEPDDRLASMSRPKRARLLELLERFEMRLSGSEGWRTAEVTAGGIVLADVNIDGLGSRVVPGLHLAGEILDVTGRLGGYNFLWAWLSGRVAGEAAARPWLVG